MKPHPLNSPELLAEEVSELRRDNARLHLLLIAHGIDDPTHTNLTARERAVLTAAYKRELGHREEAEP